MQKLNHLDKHVLLCRSQIHLILEHLYTDIDNIRQNILVSRDHDQGFLQRVPDTVGCGEEGGQIVKLLELSLATDDLENLCSSETKR